MLAIIGSMALNHYKYYRKANDIDIVGTYEDINKFIKKLKDARMLKACYPMSEGKKIFISTEKFIIEAEVAWEDSTAKSLLKIIEETHENTGNLFDMEDVMIPPTSVLYMLKMSHRYRKDSPHFLKTMEDIHYLRNEMFAVIPKDHAWWYFAREKETYQNELPKLNVSKKEFFNNSTSIYTLDHDDIHMAIKLLNRPAYEYFKPDENEVYCSKDMFFKLPYRTQLLAGYEEACVLSIERSIHPYPDVKRKWAFDTALMKLCTSISSGWFREFCWENYYQIQDLYDVEYVDRFYEELYNGNIKNFKEG